MKGNRYFLPGLLLLAGLIGFSLFDGNQIGESISKLLSALGIFGLIYVWRTTKKGA